MGNWREHPWAGVFPATLCPFHADESIDEDGLQTYIAELASVEGVKGLTCNGHTGEIMSLRFAERNRVTQIVAAAIKATGRDIKTISGVSAEGSLEGIDHALAAQEAGADAILLMPPHHWLRFGRSARTAVGFFEDVASAGVDIVVHQYPAWTRAGYALDEMKAMVQIPEVKCIKMGTREMSRWLFDYQELKKVDEDVPIITCHDEFLLPTLLEAADGALVGFAGFVPELIVELVHRALDGDYAGARETQKKVEPLNRIVYAFGEPSSSAHQRMKCARWLMGKFPSPQMRRPLRDLGAEEIAAIRRRLEDLGYECVQK
ncbi:MAG: dihydrodipicolinate synthase family protein [Gemmatimonadetes bacterium]|nr:dihydrodipicolinate synthase family protein [Gemmatimonadota bacterium]|tara:strand:- start:978 stop:1931 length:954 start_codon:yes stop_codon:yes gene_type:complete